VTEAARDRSGRMSAEPGMAQGHQQNPIWSFPGFRIDKTRSWGLISTDVVSRDGGEAIWRSDRHRIVYALTNIPGTIQSDDRPVEKDGLLRKKIAFRPSGGTVRSNLPAAVRFIQILQSPETYDTFICEMVRGGAVHLGPRAQVNDPQISRIVLTIANDIKGGFLGHVLADALNTALAVQLMRQFVDSSAITLAPSRERLKRVRDYIEAHLSDRLTLTDIAGVACLSPYHLSRSFKRATGIGLHRYVVRRRIERAKELVQKTDLPLAEIAWAVGFDSQASFTARFRQEIGMPPGRLRAARA
jgi:AraC-like DNA-binding protein